jgi:rhodanese-related sulfurtransferase
MSEGGSSSYGGDVSAADAWRDLKATPEATLVDVRTAAEWAYVGLPTLDSIGKRVLLVAWDDFPSGALVPDFIGRLKSALATAGVGTDAPIYFLCRSGNRSRHAAIAATAAGYRRAYNIELGFEGRLDASRHRGTAGSWKAENLPWVQS